MGSAWSSKGSGFCVTNAIVIAEEIVSEDVIRADPNRTLIPGLIVNAVVCEPFSCHPSYAQGYYDRDNDFYVHWRDISNDVDQFNAYLDEWITVCEIERSTLNACQRH